ncbi:MAG: hypothetical protein A3I12_05785 [Gammaproteobacteria bacterium RIFCSPLOWO2_02_FULL_38_11]|nr:MAG: hypothetical protein A3I12_05785 [Gammaproteobacteria bacterium RIFCSPLOWO2_02_FULL_38_11]
MPTTGSDHVNEKPLLSNPTKKTYKARLKALLENENANLEDEEEIAGMAEKSSFATAKQISNMVDLGVSTANTVTKLTHALNVFSFPSMAPNFITYGLDIQRLSSEASKGKIHRKRLIAYDLLNGIVLYAGIAICSILAFLNIPGAGLVGAILAMLFCTITIFRLIQKLNRATQANNNPEILLEQKIEKAEEAFAAGNTPRGNLFLKQAAMLYKQLYFEEAALFENGKFKKYFENKDKLAIETEANKIFNLQAVKTMWRKRFVATFIILFAAVIASSLASLVGAPFVVFALFASIVILACVIGLGMSAYFAKKDYEGWDKKCNAFEDTIPDTDKNTKKNFQELRNNMFKNTLGQIFGITLLLVGAALVGASLLLIANPIGLGVAAGLLLLLGTLFLVWHVRKNQEIRQNMENLFKPKTDISVSSNMDSLLPERSNVREEEPSSPDDEEPHSRMRDMLRPPNTPPQVTDSPPVELDRKDPYPAEKNFHSPLTRVGFHREPHQASTPSPNEPTQQAPTKPKDS